MTELVAVEHWRQLIRPISLKMRDADRTAALSIVFDSGPMPDCGKVKLMETVDSHSLIDD